MDFWNPFVNKKAFLMINISKIKIKISITPITLKINLKMSTFSQFRVIN